MGKCILAGHPQISEYARIGYGTYTGTQSVPPSPTTGQIIELGIRPKWVLVVNARGDAGSPGTGQPSGGLALDGYPVKNTNNQNIIEIIPNGFHVRGYATINESTANPYRYIYGY